MANYSFTHFIIVYFVPESHLALTKDALFTSGAGTWGHYTRCSFECLGQGQFMPLAKSMPFLGEQDRLSQVAEYRVEMICPKEKLKTALIKLTETHPYETPAYHFYPLYTLQNYFIPGDPQ